MSEVGSADVLEVLTPIWHVNAHTARSVRQRISAVMEWAVAMDYRADNPCGRVGPVLGRQHNHVRHMRALPHQEVTAAIRTVRASRSKPIVKLAFEFQVLTAARPGEVRGARWTEIDMDAGVWTVPVTRMKANREHRVPLSRRAGGDSQRGADARHWRAARVSKSRRRTARREAAALAAEDESHRGRASRVPLIVSRLGSRGDGPPAGGDRGSAGAHGAEQGRSRLCPVGPVRAPAAADGRVGRVRRWWRTIIRPVALRP